MAYPAAPSYPAISGATGGSTAPSLAVADRLDGAAYTVAAGSRSLTITNTDGASLLTTVRKASDGSAITVTSPNGESPSWSVAAGGQEGESYQVRVRATKDSLTTHVAFTERVVSTGLKDIALEQIDLTDGWTLEDPDNLIDTVSFGSGKNTITWNAAVGSADLVMTNGSNFRGPRWYKLLSISGQQATTATPLIFVTDIEPDNSSASDFGQKHYIGTSHNPTSTVTDTIKGVGAVWQINDNGTTIQMGAWTRTTTSLQSSSLNQRQIMASLRGFESLGSPSFMNIRSNDVVAATNARASGQNAIGGSGANLYVVVALGTNANSAAISAGDQTIFAAHFIASSYTGI